VVHHIKKRKLRKDQIPEKMDNHRRIKSMKVIKKEEISQDKEIIRIINLTINRKIQILTDITISNKVPQREVTLKDMKTAIESNIQLQTNNKILQANNKAIEKTSKETPGETNQQITSLTTITT